MKKVSIVMPVYNMADRILISVEALLNQTYPNIEIILIDDGSLDDSYQNCLNFAKQHPKVKVFHTENRGAGLARNHGIQVASGDYVYFPDADDLLQEDALDILVQTMVDRKCDLIVFGYQHITHDGKIQAVRKYAEKAISGATIRNNYEHYLSFREPLWIQGAPWNKFFDLHLIKAHGVAFPDLRRHQDEVFISRYVEYVSWVQFIPQVLYTYYANDVKKEWDKYPVDYLNIAMELRRYREQIIINWNPANARVKEIIAREYIFNVIKGFELSFSQKMALNRQERREWLSRMVAKTQIKELDLPATPNMKYQGLVMKLIKGNRLNQFYYLLFIKVFLQKNMYPLFLKLKQQV